MLLNSEQLDCSDILNPATITLAELDLVIPREYLEILISTQLFAPLLEPILSSQFFPSDSIFDK